MMTHLSITRFFWTFTALGLVVACGAPAASDTDNDNDGGAVGGSYGMSSGGTESGAGGAIDPGAGGAVPGAGGAVDPAAGGSMFASGGMPDPGAGGSDVGVGGGADPGAGGSSPVTGGAPGSGGEGPIDPCATASICDDFEDGMDAAWEIQKDSVPQPEVDGTKSVSGTSSLKVTGTSQQSFVAVPVPDQAFYTRAYMNFEQDTTSMTGHGWFVVAADNVTSGDESQIRFGSSSNHGHPELDVNVYAPTCSGEKTQFSDGASDGGAGWQGETTESVNLTGGTWYCVEVYFNGTGNEAQVWIDGEALTGLHVTEASMCAGWAPTFTHIKFGAGANSNIGAIWYDDIAVSTTRIGCN